PDESPPYHAVGDPAPDDAAFGGAGPHRPPSGPGSRTATTVRGRTHPPPRGRGRTRSRPGVPGSLRRPRVVAEPPLLPQPGRGRGRRPGRVHRDLEQGQALRR